MSTNSEELIDPFEEQLNIIENSTTSTVDKLALLLKTPSKNEKRKKASQSNTKGKQSLFESGSLEQSFVHHYQKALKKAFRDRNQYQIRRLNDQSFIVEKLMKKGNLQRVASRFKNRQDTTYYVNFQEKEVVCSCLDYVEIISKYQDRICKHISCILLKCNLKNFAHLKGSRTYKGNSFQEVFETLSTFDEDQDIIDVMTVQHLENDSNEEPLEHSDDIEDVDDLHVAIGAQNWSNEDFRMEIEDITEQKPQKIPDRIIRNSQRGPYSKIGGALQSAEDNEWFVEVYSDKGSPRCRSIHCKRKIEKNKACIRTDVACTYSNRKTGEKYLTIDKIRFCLNTWCHETSDPTKMKYKKFNRMTQLNLQYLAVTSRDSVNRIFLNSDVRLINLT